MDNKIEVFKNEQFGEVRTILDGETLLFCGSDVARALGYARPGKAIIDHCKGVLKRDTLTSGGTQSLSYITEGDVYRLIVHSKLPSAERFEHWLFDEVVPMIRKTGCYMTESLLDRIQKEPAVIIELAQTLLKETNRANALEAELGIARPKADYFDVFVNPDDCTNIRTTAKSVCCWVQPLRWAQVPTYRTDSLPFIIWIARGGHPIWNSARDVLSARETGSRKFRFTVM